MGPRPVSRGVQRFIAARNDVPIRINECDDPIWKSCAQFLVEVAGNIEPILVK